MIVPDGFGEFLEGVVLAGRHFAKLYHEAAFRGQYTVLDCVGCVILGKVLFEIDVAGKFGRIALGKLHVRFILNTPELAQQDWMATVCYREPVRAWEEAEN